MSESLELYGEHGDNTKIEEHFESSIVQDDYKKLKQENERYKQELYVLRLKLEISNSLEKELQETNETLEQSLVQCTAKLEGMLSERDEKYRTAREEYNNHIASLEANIVQSAQEITQLHEELRKYKDLMNDRLHNLTYNEDNLIPYKERNEELIILLQNEAEKREQLEEKCASIESQYQELKDILKITREQLAENNMTLESLREELAATRTELESIKVRPASETCKGNSLFAEVEDHRQMLLDKMKALQNKYTEAKRVLNTKMDEIRILTVEKAAMVRKWETDAIDTLQENTDLLDKYKSKVFELENKLKTEMKRNSQVIDEQFTSDSFNYAQSLLAVKKKELEQLNEKFLKQSMEMLAQEEATHNISKQFRYWQSKAMFLEVKILEMKSQMVRDRMKDSVDKFFDKTIENCATPGNMDFEKTCNLKIVSDMPDNVHQQKLTELSEKPVMDNCINRQKDGHEKVVRFVKDTKEIESKPLKIQSKRQDYPIIFISDSS